MASENKSGLMFNALTAGSKIVGNIILVFPYSAGARFTTIRLPGMRKPLSSKADEMRWALSFTALSGRPTIKKPTPSPTFTSTVKIGRAHV